MRKDWTQGMTARPLRKLFLLLVLLSAIGLAAVQVMAWLSGPSRELKRVILIAVDTLRVDHVSAFGYHRKTTPHLEEMLRKDGIGFSAAHSPSSWTLPSSVSLMTSLPASLHEVEDRSQTLHPEIPTLAGAFSKHGWLSAAFVTHIYVSSLFGFDSGFDEFHEVSIDWQFREGKQLRAGELNELVLPWLTAAKDKRFFLYLHYFDPHWDYDPPPPFDTKFTSPAYSGPASGSWKYIVKFVPTTELMSEADLAHVKALYDGEIAYTDHHLNKLFEHLKSLGMWDDSLIVLLSDHGEEFQDHGSMHHIRTLYEEVLRVPLIFKLPGGRPLFWRQRVGTRVSTVDVAPTVLDLAGIPIPKTFQGKSLRPLMKIPTKDREIFARTMRHKSDAMTLIQDDKKLIMPFGRKKADDELYDLRIDPVEQSSIAHDRPGLTDVMKSALRKIGGVTAASKGLPGAGADAELTPEQTELLKALGYIQ
jgi:arylsulfatase A-like enzyme